MDTLQIPSFDVTPPAQGAPRTAPQTPGVNKGKAKQDAKRPTLIIPPPQTPTSPYSMNITMPPQTAHTIPGTPHNPYMYHRKASEFMFSQFNGIRDFTMATAKSGLGIGEKCSFWLYNKLSSWSKQWFTHMFLTIVLVIYTVGGAVLFQYIEGGKEIKERDYREQRYKLLYQIQSLWANMTRDTSEPEWIARVHSLIEQFEADTIDHQKALALAAAHDNRVWSMWNSVVYCATIYTTIGYGHVYPITRTGQALTIVYSIIGIPLFLIALTDFGKLFTRCIKFAWSYVRRLYYTGSCRQVRKTAHVQEIFKGAQMMYEIATFRRPSQFNIDPEAANNIALQQQRPHTSDSIHNDTPTTPAPSNYEIDEEFNLPVTLAIFILVLYIFLGAVFYMMTESWDFMTAFYFVFISMSTIGFGDYVPKSNPIFMMITIIYLVFGLALMSMCINVVQIKLSDTFSQASAKIGATIGLSVAEDDGSIVPAPTVPVEMPEVHGGKVKEGDATNENGADIKVEQDDEKEKEQ